MQCCVEHSDLKARDLSDSLDGVEPAYYTVNNGYDDIAYNPVVESEYMDTAIDRFNRYDAPRLALSHNSGPDDSSVDVNFVPVTSEGPKVEIGNSGVKGSVSYNPLNRLTTLGFKANFKERALEE